MKSGSGGSRTLALSLLVSGPDPQVIEERILSAHRKVELALLRMRNAGRPQGTHCLVIETHAHFIAGDLDAQAIPALRIERRGNAHTSPRHQLGNLSFLRRVLAHLLDLMTQALLVVREEYLSGLQGHAANVAPVPLFVVTVVTHRIDAGGAAQPELELDDHVLASYLHHADRAVGLRL